MRGYSFNVPSVNLAINDRIYVKVKATDAGVDAGLGIMNHISCPYFNIPNSYINFEVVSPGGQIPDEFKKDVKVSHTVQALGFTLDDVKIPKSIADKVQGFRIYHAKRTHADKRILGQSVALPMMPAFAKIGLCKAAWDYNAGGGVGNTYGQQILSTVQDTKVNILRKEPFPNWDSYYPQYSIYQGEDNSIPFIDDHGYKSFSFPDFNLLRTKGSISGATHIKPEYVVQNFAWNGATLKQNKKMISKIVEDNGGGSYSPPIKRVVEEWGYDVDLNCWGKEVASALFIGKLYTKYGSTPTVGGNGPTRNNFSLPRVIGQASKSYLRGDSIFNAEALGFGGTVLNDGGESSLIFSLKNHHEMIALDQSLSASGNPYNAYGKYTDANPFLLVGEPGINARFRKSNISIVNLHAFKTDMYKSIDTQELVWTGFEVVGQDIQNFIFDDSDPNAGVPLTFDYVDKSGAVTSDIEADYSIETLQESIQKDNNGNQIDSSQYHIFGGDTFICRYGAVSSLTGLDSLASYQMKKSINYQIVESPDNINFRHSESDESLSFPNTPAKTTLASIGDLTHMDNIKYNSNYSAVNDVRPAFPLPSNIGVQDDFPTRTHRSAKSDSTSLIDNYRVFLANQFKDLPKNRGELWKLSSFNNLLYFHMEDSLFAAKGKQSMSMKDGSEAFVGSGDIFQQEPDEVIQTSDGFGGTQSKYAALSTRHGYFFVNRKSRKVFLMKDKLSEISKLGMNKWFKDNMSFVLEPYGASLDNHIRGFGFHAVYDPKYKRILLTKREIKPTDSFLKDLELYYINYGLIGDTNNIRYNPITNKYEEWVSLGVWESIEWNDTAYFNYSSFGWTISYYPELGIWGSFHDYIPYIYFNTSTDFYSLTDKYLRPAWNSLTTPNEHVGTTFGNAGIWQHNSDNNKGLLYKENTLDKYTEKEWLENIEHVPFEFEFIHNETKTTDTLLSSFNYTAEVFNSSGVNILEHGFTKFFLYNTFQLSGESNLEYLVNTRRVGNNWKVNYFRDMAALVNQVGTLNTRNTSSYYMQGVPGNLNIVGGSNIGTVTTSSIQAMFTVNGMSKIINNGYLDLAKSWDQKRKFIDKWVGIRLIYDNISNNLLNLYSTNVEVRKMHR